ncbi:MAG: cbb3-type cytochrome c oxidase subunit 3 [Deltaproteobacteria bacterium]|jgi:cytochrome c oxidase cbb3-type subunit 4|nr:cbb3-type cytochrome c oxidase subunit 3 [Deltaproteobacteria bacterium]
MDINDFRGLITLVTMLTYGGVCWWAYSSRNRSRFEDDAMLPFADEQEPTTTSAGDRER